MKHIVVCQDIDSWKDSYFFGPFDSSDVAERWLEGHRHDVYEDEEVARLAQLWKETEDEQFDDACMQAIDRLPRSQWCENMHAWGEGDWLHDFLVLDDPYP